MAFYPTVTTLNTINELKNLSHTITYVETTGATGVVGSDVSYPVTVTTSMPNNTIYVVDNSISGYYSDAFNNEIKYRTVDDKFVTVNKWQDIALAIASGSLSELYYYKADTTNRIVYTYTATANGHSQTYTINVDNDWTFGRNQLIKYTNLSAYQQKILVEWINNNIDKVKWLNNVVDVIDWENSNL
jgi:hypothetical protein